MTTPPHLPSLSDFEDEPELLGIQPRARSAREPGQPATSPTLRPRREAPAAAPAPGPAPRRGRPQTRPASETASGLTRSSNVQIPSALLGPIRQRRSAEGLTTGELIIAALEASADRLPHLMEDRPVTGGSLFKARSAHVSRSAEPLTNLNFRLLVEDFEILDQLVLRVNAPSRSQLVTAALIAYLNEGSPT
jgi:hypothetical protein